MFRPVRGDSGTRGQLGALLWGGAPHQVRKSNNAVVILYCLGLFVSAILPRELRAEVTYLPK